MTPEHLRQRSDDRLMPWPEIIVTVVWLGAAFNSVSRIANRGKRWWWTDDDWLRHPFRLRDPLGWIALQRERAGKEPIDAETVIALSVGELAAATALGAVVLFTT